MKIENTSKEILFHANAYKEGIIDKDDFTQAVEDILGFFWSEIEKISREQ